MHLNINPMLSITTANINLHNCLQHTGRSSFVSDLILENLTIICSSSTSDDSNDILQYIRTWTKQFPTCNQLQIPLPWQYHIAKTIHFILDTNFGLQRRKQENAITLEHEIQQPYDLFEAPDYLNALHRVTDTYSFLAIHAPKAPANAENTSDHDRQILVDEINSYKKKTSKHPEDTDHTVDAKQWKCMGCNYVSPNKSLLESHCHHPPDVTHKEYVTYTKEDLAMPASNKNWKVIQPFPTLMSTSMSIRPCTKPSLSAD